MASLNLPGVEVKSFTPVNVEEITKKQLQDRDDQYKGHKARMSWQDIGKMPNPKDPKSVGRVDRNYPYSLVEGRYYIQNCKCYLGNGLTEIDPYTYDFDKDNPFERERLRARVLDAFTSYNQAALDEDPLLCPYCMKFHARSPLEFADHIVSAHADKYGQHLGYDEGEEKKPEPPPVEIPFMPPVPPNYVATSSIPTETVRDAEGHPIGLETPKPDTMPEQFRRKPRDITPLICVGVPCNCGRTFMGPAALKLHRTRYMNRAAGG